ncbi:MAG: sugar phosphate isomerase/epimerase family protein [Bacteroidota bacterium]
MTFSWLTDTVTMDIDRAIHYTLLWGLDGVDLRMIGKARVPNVREEKLRRRLDEAELPVTSIDPGFFELSIHDRAGWMNDLAMFPEALSFCRRLGCRTIVVGGFEGDRGRGLDDAASALQRLSDQADRFDVVIAVRNEGTAIVRTGGDLASLLGRVDRPNVRAAWQPVAALAAGDEVGEGLRQLTGRVQVVRCANVDFSSEHPVHVGLADGIIDWRAHLRTLFASGFDGTLSMEMLAEPRKKQAVRDVTWAIHAWREIARAG